MHRLSFPDFLFEPFKSCYTSIITIYSITDNIDLPLQADFLLWLPACKQPVHLGDRRSDSRTDTSCWETFTRTFCGFCPSLSQTVTSALLPPGDWWKHRIRHRGQYSRCDNRYAPRISSSVTLHSDLLQLVPWKTYFLSLRILSARLFIA